MIITALAGLVLGQSAARAATPTVSVFPSPGTHLASPQTQITLRGVAPAAIGPVSVTGSRSGGHSGHIAADSDGRGASFIPDHPFTPGESVTVSTGLAVIGTGPRYTATSGTYGFTVASPAPGFPVLHWPPAPRQRSDVQSFHSRPDLAPASVAVTRAGAPGDGDIFVTPQWGPVQDGPMILDPSGNLVWFDNLKGEHGDDSAADFRMQTLHGQPVLTWWQGHLVAGVGIGQDVIFDSTYREIATVNAGNGLRADLHEFALTPQGTALVTAAYPVYYDASAVHGPRNQIVLDSVVQEIDIPTGLVLFQWDSLDHVPLSYTYSPLPRSAHAPFDPDHLNSVELDRDGNLIVSARNTWAAYKVDHRTGAVLWTLGGRRSSFRLAAGTYWAFQHDVRVHASNDRFVTLFDDDAGPPTIHSQSRAIKLFLDLRHMTAKQVSGYEHAPALSSGVEGNVQQLANQNQFVGWGQQPYVTEYDTRGRPVFDAHFVAFTSSYRAYRFPWNAVPWNLPAVAASRGKSSSTVYVSWNGATGVASWRVLGGASASTLSTLATAAKRSFETAIKVPTQTYVEVQALDAHGGVMRTSAAVAVH